VSKLADATENEDAFGSFEGAVPTVGEAGAGEAGVEAADALRRWSLLPLLAEEARQLRRHRGARHMAHTPILT
jgi:hypothetical protein